jgi:valyl-tRNA synthetase
VLEEDFIDKWIDSRFNSELDEVEKCLTEYKLNDYTKALYNFVWSDFCDWYIEILKVKINTYPNAGKTIISKALKIYEDVVKLLHPVIPFVTEEIWHILENGRDGKSVSFAEFPEIDKKKINSESEKKFEIFQEIVSGIRNLKAENDIPFSEKCKVFAICSSEIAEKTFDEYHDYIFNLCNLDTLEKTKKLVGDNYLSKVLADFEIHVPFEVTEKQIEKYKKEIENLEKYISNIDKKLSNQGFVQKAPKELIEGEKAKREEAMAKLEKLRKLV